MSASLLEQILEADLKRSGITGWEREHMPIEGRRWRLDFAFVDRKVGVEVEGGTDYRSRHTSRTGFEKDCIKYNACTADGWRVFRFTSGQVKRGEVVPVLRQVLEAE